MLYHPGTSGGIIFKWGQVFPFWGDIILWVILEAYKAWTCVHFGCLENSSCVYASARSWWWGSSWDLTELFLRLIFHSKQMRWPSPESPSVTRPSSHVLQFFEEHSVMLWSASPGGSFALWHLVGVFPSPPGPACLPAPGLVMLLKMPLPHLAQTRRLRLVLVNRWGGVGGKEKT